MSYHIFEDRDFDDTDFDDTDFDDTDKAKLV